MSAMSVMRSRGLLGVSIHTQRRGLRQRGVDRGGIAEVARNRPSSSPRLLPRREQTERAAVAIVRRDDARAHGQQVPDQRDGAHAGARDDGAGAAFEIGERFGRAGRASDCPSGCSRICACRRNRERRRSRTGAAAAPPRRSRRSFRGPRARRGCPGSAGRHPGFLDVVQYVGEDRREAPVLLQEGIVAVNRGDLVQLGVRQARHHRAHVRRAARVGPRARRSR